MKFFFFIFKATKMGNFFIVLFIFSFKKSKNTFPLVQALKTYTFFFFLQF